MSEREEIKSIRYQLIECLEQIQKMTAEPDEEITEDTVPIGGLSNFDSLRGVCTTVIIEQKLGWNIPSKGETANIFISTKGDKALSVKEIAMSLYKLKK